MDVRRTVELRGNHRQLPGVVVGQQALQGGQRQPGLRDIRQQPAEANRQQQQRLELLRNRQPQQQQAHQQHDGLADAEVHQAHPLN
ncbi:hypothetical protein SEEH1831_13903, partial [Salmonella enterica subsp. enterica serovar Heidelberg str. 77-1831]